MYWSKIARFFVHHVYLEAPVRGDRVGILERGLDHRKLDLWVYQAVKQMSTVY